MAPAAPPLAVAGDGRRDFHRQGGPVQAAYRDMAVSRQVKVTQLDPAGLYPPP